MIVCDTNRIDEGAVMWTYLRYVNETIANKLNSPICAIIRSSPIASPVHHVDNRSRKLLQSYPKVMKNSLKKCATDQELLKIYAAI